MYCIVYGISQFSDCIQMHVVLMRKEIKSEKRFKSINKKKRHFHKITCTY